MTQENNKPQKTALFIDVFPYEKEAFEKWIRGRYHSIADAVRSHIRKVTGLDPETQEKKQDDGQAQSACTD